MEEEPKKEEKEEEPQAPKPLGISTYDGVGTKDELN
jgi:hypothetical protein